MRIGIKRRMCGATDSFSQNDILFARTLLPSSKLDGKLVQKGSNVGIEKNG